MNHEPTARNLPTARFGIHLAIYISLVFFAICFESVTGGTPANVSNILAISDAMAPRTDAGVETIAPSLPPEPTPRMIRVNKIVSALRSVFAGDVKTDEMAVINAEAALEAEEQTGVDANLLLGIAWAESRYDPNALSRWQCHGKSCGRDTTTWSGSEQPAGSSPPWYCGVTQVGGNVTWQTCQTLRENIRLNYLTGAKHLLHWSKQKPCPNKKDNFYCALRGYNGGYDRELLKQKIAFVTSSATAVGYALNVQYQQKRLKKAQDFCKDR